jgi:hypothetical protein
MRGPSAHLCLPVLVAVEELLHDGLRGHLVELVRGGHRFDLDEIVAYAMATGWTGQEVERIREYGQRILEGRGFRLRSPIGPQQGACSRWEAEAEKNQ